MNGWRSIVVATLACAAAAPLSAHRLDEYLQAARLHVERDRIRVELDLTPGVAVADTIFGLIDRDGSGSISSSEAHGYAERVVEDLALSLDDRPFRLNLASTDYPSREQMEAGVGVIRVTADAHLPAIAGGRHRLTFRNQHQPLGSVYLVNALLPDAPISILGQVRDPDQRELRLDYRVASLSARWSSGLSTAAIGLVLAVPVSLLWRRRRLSAISPR